jgi:dethiobiotin synthetase
MITRFVTATGTGVGKTLVTAALCHQLRSAGKTVRALKPVMTGLAETPLAGSDPAILLRSLGRPFPPDGKALDSICPFRFAAPLAPSMAAAKEGGSLDLDALLAFCRGASAGPEDVLLIEGVGGVMVPLAPGLTVLDWIGALGGPAILVTGSYLGSLSHTLTALSVLRAARIPLCGVVVSETQRAAVGLTDAVEALRAWVPEAPVLALPRIQGPDPWLNAAPLTALV